MLKQIFSCLIYTFYLTSGLANTGVFLGAGSTVMPIKNDKIQMKEENVVITLSVPENSGAAGLPFVPTANVEANFTFLNTTNAPQSLQLGFPFHEQFLSDKDEVLKNLNFQVQSGIQKMSPKLKEGVVEKILDPTGEFKRVMVWSDTFAPNSLKTVKVSYKLPVSFGLFPAMGGFSYFFPYITKTAYTWKQPLEKVVFIFDFSRVISSFKTHFRDKIPSHICKFLPIISLPYPEEGIIDNSILRITYTGKVPEEGIPLSLVVTLVPAKHKDLDAYLKDLKDKKLYNNKDFTEKDNLEQILVLYKMLHSGVYSDDFFKKVQPRQTSSKKFPYKKIYLFFEEDKDEIAKIISDLEQRLKELK